MPSSRTAVLLLLGALPVSALPLAAQPPGGGHGFHAPMPGQELYLEGRVEQDGAVKSTVLVLSLPSTMADAPLQQQLQLPPPQGAVRLRQYLPQARRRQEVVNDPAGRPAMFLAIFGRKQSFERWLVSDDPDRNRLTSLVGTWRYHAVESAKDRDALREQFENEARRPPTLQVSRADSDKTAQLPAARGPARTLGELGCDIEVLEFFPHFAYEEKSQKPINQSDKRINPAALVRIRTDGKSEDRWVFAKFPDYRGHDGPPSPISVVLDCPVEMQNPAPDFVIVTVGGARHEVWMRHEGRINAQKLEAGKPVAIPASDYQFEMRNFSARARLEEAYEPSDERRDAVTALCVDAPPAAGIPRPIWLELGKPRVIRTDQGVVTLLFGSRPAGNPGGRP